MKSSISLALTCFAELDEDAFVKAEQVINSTSSPKSLEMTVQ